MDAVYIVAMGVAVLVMVGLVVGCDGLGVAK
jgi:hypothetical protein